MPSVGAVQVHQTDFPPRLSGKFGSPDSFVALTFDPDTEIDEPVIVFLEAKSSFDGCACATADFNAKTTTAATASKILVD
jgi:hypothetical protein